MTARAPRGPGPAAPDQFDGHLTGHGTLTDPHATGHGTRGARASGLRLVRHELSPNSGITAQERREAAQRTKAIIKENKRSSAISGADARGIMAQRVAEQLDGGRAAILAPERRRALVSTAERLGLRPFDANLIIAVVQDRFRQGLTGRAGAAGDERLDLIPHPELVRRRRERLWSIVRMSLASLAIAVIGVVWLINWLTGA